MSKSYTNGERLLGSAAACLMLVGWSLSVSAQVGCSLDRWTVGAGGLTSEVNTGSRADGFSRYAGPCSLRIPVGETPAYLETPETSGEPGYFARFYLNRASAGTRDVMIFAARGGGENLVQIHYNDPSPGDFSLHTFNASNDAVITFPAADVPDSAWVSVELVWSAGSEAENVMLSISGSDRFTTLDTSGLQIESSLLGNIVGSAGTGKLYFDDFDSRRSTRPGRLCRGLTDPDRAPASDGWQRIGSLDRQAIFFEVATGGGAPAGGQPDFLENGTVGSADRQAIFFAVAGGNNSCKNLR